MTALANQNRWQNKWYKIFKKILCVVYQVSAALEFHCLFSYLLWDLPVIWIWLKRICYSVAKSCPALCDPIDYSRPGFSVLHHLSEFAQTQVHWVGMPSNRLIFCHPLLLLPSIFLIIFNYRCWGRYYIIIRSQHLIYYRSLCNTSHFTAVLIPQPCLWTLLE